MPEPIHAGGVRVTQIFTLPNLDVAMNVLHFKMTTGDFLDDAGFSPLAVAVKDAWNTTLKTKMSDAVKLWKIRVQDLSSSPYRTNEFVYNLAGTEGTTNGLPWQLSAVLSLRSATAGRRGRGRVFLPGFTEAGNAATGTIEPTLVTAVQAWGTAVDAISAVGSQALTWAVLSRANNALYPVTSWACDDRWDIQRRRANRRLG